MSIHVMSRVFLTSLPPSKKIVLLVLADFSDDEGRKIFPSVEVVARKASLSRRSVQAIIAEFLKDGLLHTTKNPYGGAPGTTRHIEIDLARLDSLVAQARGAKSAPVRNTGADHDPQGEQTNAETGASPAPKPPVIPPLPTTEHVADDADLGGGGVFLEGLSPALLESFLMNTKSFPLPTQQDLADEFVGQLLEGKVRKPERLLLKLVAAAKSGTLTLDNARALRQKREVMARAEGFQASMKKIELDPNACAMGLSFMSPQLQKRLRCEGSS